MNHVFSSIPLVFLALLSSCSTTLEAKAEPGARLDDSRTYFVARHDKDGRGIDQLISAELQRWGRNAQAGDPASMPSNVEVLVTYQDRWYWDLTMYMISLDLQFRDSRTEAVLASGKTMRTSLVRKSPEYMVHEVLAEVFSKACPDEPAPPAEP